MKFSDKCVKVDTSNAMSFIRSFVTLTVVAPYRLCIEVSSKIMFLGRQAINGILITAIGVNVLIIIFASLNERLTPFLFFVDKIDTIFSLIILLVLIILFNVIKFQAYDQLYALRNVLALYDDDFFSDDELQDDEDYDEDYDEENEENVEESEYDEEYEDDEEDDEEYEDDEEDDKYEDSETFDNLDTSNSEFTDIDKDKAIDMYKYVENDMLKLKHSIEGGNYEIN